MLLLLGTLGAGALAAAPIDVAFSPLPLSEQQAAADDVDASLGEVPVDPLEQLDTTVAIEDWQRLADCESGDRDADGEPEDDSARWDYGLRFDHGDHFQGGLNFHPETWESFRDPDMPSHAGRAAPPEEIEVAERVFDAQGWGAWPVCSKVVDLDG